jgi:hypothetical protein
MCERKEKTVAVELMFPVLPVLVVCILILWWRQTSRRNQYLILLVLVIGGLFGPGIVGLTGLTPTPLDMYMRGFARYAKYRADVEAIRSWLGSLNRKDYILGEYGTNEKRFVESEQPPCIATLHPKWATVRPDDSQHLTVRLLWGGGFIGHWGIVVGPKDMPMPPSDARGSGEQHFPLTPGSYIWSGQ